MRPCAVLVRSPFTSERSPGILFAQPVPPSRSLSERLRRGSRRTTSTSPARMWESASALGFVSRWFPALNCYCRLDKPKTFPRRGHACTDQHILGWLSIFCSGAVIPSSVIFYRIAPLCLH